MFEVKLEGYDAKQDKKKCVWLVNQPTFGGAEETAYKHAEELKLTEASVKSMKRSNLIVGEFNAEKPAFALVIEFEAIDGKPYKEQHLVSAASIDDASTMNMNGEIKKITSSKIQEVL